MRSLATAVFVCLLAGLASLPVAAAPKIGFVDVAKIMEEAPQAEAARAELEKEFKPRDQSLAAEREAIMRLEDKLKRDRDVMSESQRQSISEEIRDRTRQFKRERDAFKEDFSLQRKEALSKLQEEIYQVILEVAEQYDYDLVMADAIYASDQIDMSDLVLRRLRRSYQR